MTGPATRFSRLIIDLGLGASDRTALRFAAEFAALLQIDLVGVFAHDPRLASLVASPLLREFRTLEGRWTAVPGGDIARDLESTAAFARRSLDEASRCAGVSCRFELAHATLAEAMAALSSAADIVIANQPAARPGAHRTFEDVLVAALATPAAVLVVPGSIGHRRGPILAITEAEGAADVTACAAAIAAAANERLEAIVPSSLRFPPPWGLPDRIGERLIVTSREVFTDASEIAVRRRAPVLVMPPSRPVGSATRTGAR